MAPRCRAGVRGRGLRCGMRFLNDYWDDGERAFFRPFGHATPGELADMSTAALLRAFGHGCEQALLNLVRMYGFESPGPAYRRWLVRRWARTVFSSLDIVVVCRPEHLSPDHAGLVAAMEEGLSAHVCTDEAEAMAWLETSSAMYH